MSITQTVGQGYNWQVAQWPYITPTDDGGMVIQGDADNPLWFDDVEGDFECFCDPTQMLNFDPDSNRYILSEPDGSVTEFDAVTGNFRSKSTPSGNQIQVTALAGNNYNIAQVQRSATISGITTTEQLAYSYGTSTGDHLVSQVTLQRKVGAGSFENVTRAVYTYFGDDDPNGLSGDLKTVVTQVWLDGAWAATGTSYYRYWLELESSSSSSSSSSSGGSDAPFAHLPKYVLNPAAYDRMVADGLDPLTESDATLSMYADYYFQYDNQRRIIRETVKSGSQTFLFEYFESGFSEDFNHWQTKTIETLPDGNQNIIYANHLGQTMLKVFQAGSDQWIDFWQYGENARVNLHANPSAVTGYDEASADLLNYDSGTATYEYLRDNAGLIETMTYHQPSGNLASQSLQEGQLGTSIPQRSMTYCQCGSDCGCGGTSSSSSSSSSSSGSAESGGIWFLASETVYPSDIDPSQTIVTSHCYSFYSGTCAVQQHVTTLPVVSVEQNGSGVADTNREYRDQYGNVTWRMDERGFITRMSYDIPTGEMTQRVDDVDTGLYDDVPAGWSTPSGGGKNVVTDFTHDDQGRITQALEPSHTTDIDGESTVIRKVSWTVYDDVNHVTYSAEGFASGTAPDYDYTLMNPVAITKRDAGGRVNEQVQAVAPSTSGTLAEIIEDAGGGEVAFPQTSYTRWTTNQYTDCCLAASQRAYPDIPDTGAGLPIANYNETNYGYTVMKWRNRTVSPGGTITDVVYDPRGQVIGTFIGMNDDGGTETDPTGGGVDPDNTMVIVSAGEYDGGTDGGDGELTERTDHVNGTTTRVTSITYDFRNRKITTDGEVNYFEKRYYDNLSRVVKVERYNTTALGNLISLTETKFDDRGRVYQTLRYAVNPATGEIGNVLIDNTWFDASGHVIKSLPAGSKQFTKTTIDSLGRSTVRYSGYDLDETSYAEAFTVTDDVILEQAETIFDDAGNVLKVTVRKRYHNAPDSQKGALQDPSTSPKARVTYAAMWQDGIGRIVATADYGTNGGTALTRPDTIPASSDTVLVSLTRFNDASNAYEAVDPTGMVTRFEFDDLGRTITEIKNYKLNSSSSSSSSSSGDGCEPSDDTNVTTRYTFTPDGQQATLTAVNPRTTDQTTTWTYGTTLDDSDVASTQLLRSLTYPKGGSDILVYGYNRQGERITLTDQRGCIHEYDYDKLGRQIHDRVTTVGTGVDDAVLRLSTTYEVRGMVETLTSWNDADVNSGDAVNHCLFFYNDFSQLIGDYQEHDGEVDTETTPVVQYAYEDGSSNSVRSTTLTYPNGRVLNYDYGTTEGINDAVSRISSLIDSDGSTHLADYSFVGLRQFVVVDYAEPDVKYILGNLSGSNDPDTGDIYSGWDRFGRMKDCRWYDSGHSTDVVRLKYGYNQVSDRVWRADTVAQSLGKDFDELCSYDGVHRLNDIQRGLLNGSNTAITDETFAQCWSLDPTSNWHGFKEAATGGSWTVDQSRSANTVNEITGITNWTGPTWITPAYDAAGNATTIPQPVDPTYSYAGTYDAWNRLVALSDDTTDDTVQKNQYDARHFRVIRGNYTSGTLAETRHSYFASRWQQIEDRLGTHPNIADAERQIVWGQRYIDDLVLRDRDTTADGSLDERLYGMQDANWSVVTMISTVATARERYLYSPYGLPTFLNGTMSVIPFSGIDATVLFTGQQTDSSTLLQLFRRRWLVTVIGRFAQRDPLDYVDGANLYSAWFVPNGTDSHGLAINKKECQDQVDDEYSKEGFIGKVLAEIQKKCGKKPKMECTRAPMNVPDDIKGKATEGGEITFYFDRLDSDVDLMQAIQHELLHVLDFCSYDKSKKRNCKMTMCMEMRAYSCTGICDNPKSRDACIQTGTLGSSIFTNKECAALNFDTTGVFNALKKDPGCYCDKPCGSKMPPTLPNWFPPLPME